MKNTFAILILLLFCVHTQGYTTDSPVSFNGKWNTNQGILLMNQTGNKVTGTYANGSGTLTGIVSNNQLKGSYLWLGNKGYFEFSLNNNGDSFTGTWERGSRKGTWTGTLVGNSPTNAEKENHSETINISGKWETNLGTMIIKQDGNLVEGTYSGNSGKFSGTLLHNKLTGSYTWNGKQGKYEFTFNTATNAFTGTWTRGSQGGKWTGKKSF